LAGGEDGRDTQTNLIREKLYNSAKWRKLFERNFVIYSENRTTRAGGNGSFIGLNAFLWRRCVMVVVYVAVVLIGVMFGAISLVSAEAEN
jgi:hypothetical protein